MSLGPGGPLFGALGAPIIYLFIGPVWALLTRVGPYERGHSCFVIWRLTLGFSYDHLSSDLALHSAALILIGDQGGAAP